MFHIFNIGWLLNLEVTCFISAKRNFVRYQLLQQLIGGQNGEKMWILVDVRVYVPWSVLRDYDIFPVHFYVP